MWRFQSKDEVIQTNDTSNEEFSVYKYNRIKSQIYTNIYYII